MKKLLIGTMAAAAFVFAGCETRQNTEDRRIEMEREDGVGGAYDEGRAPDATEVDESLEQGWEDTKQETREGWENMKDETRGAGEDAQESWNENIEQPAEREMNERD